MGPLAGKPKSYDYTALTNSKLSGAVRANVTKSDFQKIPLYQSATQKKTAQDIQSAGTILVDSGVGDA